MSRVVCCVLAVVSLCIPAGEAIAGRSGRQRFSADEWSLSIRRDGFTNQTHCFLRSKRHIFYQPRALGFAFHRSRDTLDAWYRIDDGTPVRWQDRYPALIASGATIDGPGLDNATGGVVWIPIDEVVSAHSVRIRAGSHGNGRVFRLTGFSRMLESAHRLGCSSDASFEN